MLKLDDSSVAGDSVALGSNDDNRKLDLVRELLKSGGGGEAVASG